MSCIRHPADSQEGRPRFRGGCCRLCVRTKRHRPARHHDELRLIERRGARSTAHDQPDDLGPRPPFPAVALAVLASRPAAWPALAFLEFFLSSADAALLRCLLCGILDPADELVARQRRDVLPSVKCRDGCDQSPCAGLRAACAPPHRARADCSRGRSGSHTSPGETAAAPRLTNQQTGGMRTTRRPRAPESATDRWHV